MTAKEEMLLNHREAGDDRYSIEYRWQFTDMTQDELDAIPAMLKAAIARAEGPGTEADNG